MKERRRKVGGKGKAKIRYSLLLRASIAPNTTSLNVLNISAFICVIEMRFERDFK